MRDDDDELDIFNPEDDESERAIDDPDNPRFPEEDVVRCKNRRLNAADFAGQNSCPRCGRKSEELIWINFRSPSWTWRELCGRAGPLSLCPDCSIQVQFILRVMS